MTSVLITATKSRGNQNRIQKIKFTLNIIARAVILRHPQQTTTMDDSSNVIVLQKEELDGIVSDLTHSFATPKESKDVLRINKIKEDYEQYFHKTQLEIKQMIKDCTVRVRKAEAATKVPYDNYESMSTTLKKQIGATERSTTAAENKISELKEMHEQVTLF